MKPNVLLVTPYFYPDIAANVPLMKGLRESLLERYRVDVFTNCIRSMQARREKIDEYIVCDSNIFRCQNPFTRKRNAIYKVLEYVFFSIACFIFIKNRRSRYDLVFCQSTPPLFSLNIKCAIKDMVPIVYNVQDLFPDSLETITHHKGSIILRYLEKLSYIASTSVTTISQEFIERIKRRSGVMAELLPNWVDLSQFNYIPRKENMFINKYKALFGNYFIVLYSGSIGFNCDFNTLLEAAVKLQQENIRFVFVGEGTRVLQLIKKSRKLGLQNTVFLPPQGPELVPHVYSAADICVLPMTKGAVGGSFPSKTWSILACQRDFIVNTDLTSDFASMLQKNHLAYVCEPGNVESFICAIKSAKQNPCSMSIQQRKYVQENCDKGKTLAKYNALIDKLVRTHKARSFVGLK